jgi:hypothetical protein
VALGIALTALTDQEAATGYLRGYLYGLRLAAGTPTTSELVISSANSLSQEDIHHAFAGPGWDTAQQLAVALCSRPEDIRPLWRAARTRTSPHPSRASRFLAESFG